jgi:spore coat protein U-like protein
MAVAPGAAAEWPMTAMHSLMPLRALFVGTLLAFGLLFAPGDADATINKCSVTSAGINFPAYDTVGKKAVDSTGTIRVECNGRDTESLSLNITGGYGTCPTRQMRNGTAPLVYRIFQDVTRVTPFCDGADRLNFTIAFGTTTSTQIRTFTMYGRVDGSQTPTWGTYSDPLVNIAIKRGGSQVASGTFPVNGSVSPTCSVSSGTLDFGNYSSSAAALGTATVAVNCSNGAPYNISLGGGQNLSGTTRRMARSGGGFLSYELFSNSLRTLAWGDGTALGAKVGGTGSGTGQSRTIYGRIPAGQSAAAGSYSDSVIVTVDY